MGQQVSLLKNAVKYVKNAVKYVKEKVASLIGRLLPPVVQYIVKHPIRTTFHVLQAVAFVMPSIVFTPLLGVFGFARQGVIAGSIAAWVQSSFGLVPRGSVFAILQSASTGGYGTAVASKVVRGAVVISKVVHINNDR